MPLELQFAVLWLLQEADAEIERIARSLIAPPGTPPQGVGDLGFRAGIALLIARQLATPGSITMWTGDPTDVHAVRPLEAAPDQRALEDALSRAFVWMSDELWSAVIIALAEGTDARSDLRARWETALMTDPEGLTNAISA